MIFKTPWALILIPITLGCIAVLLRKQKAATFRFSSKYLLHSMGSSLKMQFLHLPTVLRFIVLTLLLIALAGPRLVTEETVRKTEGIDIVLTIDSSGSMAAEDFVFENQRVNRLAVVKRVVAEFIELRENDRLGLVTFAALAYTVTPLTTDYSWLQKNLGRIELGFIKDGTAIGSAIMTSVARLKTSTAKSKVVILLTDGVNNGVQVDPIEAAKVAKSFGIRIYTIGAGTKGPVPFPMVVFGRRVYQKANIDIDEEVLKDIAYMTGGQYFRATDTKSLKKIYQDIDLLEKTEIEELGFFEYNELFDIFLLIALVLLVIEVLLKNTILLRIP